MKSVYILLALATAPFFSCSSQNKASKGVDGEKNTHSAAEEKSKKSTDELMANYSVAYFSSGCFWCVEAIYESVHGVEEVISGYAGGKEENADYSKVSAGATKHVESVQVFYDSTIVDYKTLVEVFFGSGDPTTPNQQGPDRGYQYRSELV